jgi:hypothetical protein
VPFNPPSRPGNGYDLPSGGGGGATAISVTINGLTGSTTYPTRSLTLTVSGGSGSYTGYSWSCIRPDGTTSTAEFTAPTSAATSFTAEQYGLTTVQCTVTDDAAATGTGFKSVSFGRALTVSITGYANAATLAAQTVTANAQRGSGVYTAFAWEATLPDGTDTTAVFTDATVSPAVLNPTQVGATAVRCTVTDSQGNVQTGSRSRNLGTKLTATITGFADTATGTQQSPQVNPVNGSGVYSTYAWTAVKPDGGATTAVFSDTAVANPTFTPVTGELGLYSITCVVTDNQGTTFSVTASAQCGTELSGAISGLATAASLAAQNLVFTPSGGSGTYSAYAWSAVLPDGTTSSADFSDAAVANPTLTPKQIGVYSVSCQVTDSTAQTATISQVVNLGTPLTVSITGFVATTGLTVQTPTANASGGSGVYTYAWSCTKPDGTSGNALLSSTTIASPTFTPTEAGLHVLACVINDGTNTASDEKNANIGTGVVTFTGQQQIQDLTGWTAFDGGSASPAIDGTSGTGTITPSGGVFTLGWSSSADPTGGGNGFENSIGFYSPAGLLPSDAFTADNPGVLTLTIEGASAISGTDSGGSDTQAEMYVHFGIMNGPFTGSPQIACASVGTDLNASGSMRPAILDGTYTVTPQNGSSMTPTANTAAFVSTLVVNINADGNPTAYNSLTFDTDLNPVQSANPRTTGTLTTFATNNDTRFVISLGCTASIARSATGGFRFYWNYIPLEV